MFLVWRSLLRNQTVGSSHSAKREKMKISADTLVSLLDGNTGYNLSVRTRDLRLLTENLSGPEQYRSWLAARAVVLCCMNSNSQLHLESRRQLRKIASPLLLAAALAEANRSDQQRQCVGLNVIDVCFDETKRLVQRVRKAMKLMADNKKHYTLKEIFELCGLDMCRAWPSSQLVYPCIRVSEPTATSALPSLLQDLLVDALTRKPSNRPSKEYLRKLFELAVGTGDERCLSVITDYAPQLSGLIVDYALGAFFDSEKPASGPDQRPARAVLQARLAAATVENLPEEVFSDPRLLSTNYACLPIWAPRVVKAAEPGESLDTFMRVWANAVGALYHRDLPYIYGMKEAGGGLLTRFQQEVSELPIEKKTDLLVGFTSSTGMECEVVGKLITKKQKSKAMAIFSQEVVNGRASADFLVMYARIYGKKKEVKKDIQAWLLHPLANCGGSLGGILIDDIIRPWRLSAGIMATSAKVWSGKAKSSYVLTTEDVSLRHLVAALLKDKPERFLDQDAVSRDILLKNGFACSELIAGALSVGGYNSEQIQEWRDQHFLPVLELRQDLQRALIEMALSEPDSTNKHPDSNTTARHFLMEEERHSRWMTAEDCVRATQLANNYWPQLLGPYANKFLEHFLTPEEETSQFINCLQGLKGTNKVAPSNVWLDERIITRFNLCEENRRRLRNLILNWDYHPNLYVAQWIRFAIRVFPDDQAMRLVIEEKLSSTDNETARNALQVVEELNYV